MLRDANVRAVALSLYRGACSIDSFTFGNPIDPSKKQAKTGTQDVKETVKEPTEQSQS